MIGGEKYLLCTSRLPTEFALSGAAVMILTTAGKLNGNQ